MALVTQVLLRARLLLPFCNGDLTVAMQQLVTLPDVQSEAAAAFCNASRASPVLRDLAQHHSY